ncbi:MAG: glycosyltransferase family 2 protein [Nostocales cyanobacterium]|nr:MAG: glycosyltransferase family 2 protein [Nostocales cyanobacterium]
MNPEVSVIVPAYNTEKYLAKAIDSVLQQTLHSLEIIVVDDASTDGTVAIAKSFTDTRVKVLVNSENLGAAATRNRAIREATGKWIAVLDSDDWYSLERLEKMLAVADEYKADMVADDLYYINDGEEFFWGTLFTESDEKIHEITQIDPVYFVNTHSTFGVGLTLGLSKPIIKREFLLEHKIEYDENIRLGQDFWFYLRCLGNGACFFVVPEPYYFYRNRLGGLTKQSQLKRWDQYCRDSKYFLEQEFYRSNHQLEEALSNRFKSIEESRPYFKVLDTISKGNLLQIVTDMVLNPSFFVHFAKRLPSRLQRRYTYYFSKSVK